jgi:hypothetical protein
LFHFGGFALVRNLKGSITAIGGTSTADFINQGGEVNRVRIRSVQDEISVSINDEIVVLTKDSSFGEGEIRLYASAAENNEHYEAIFDNLVVKNISEISEQVPINFEYNTTIRDDFDDDSSPWLSNLASGGSIDESQVFVQNNRLHVTGLKTTYLGSHQNFSGFTDFILDMGISLSEGGSCLAGISFRTDPTGGEGYVFYLDSDGILKLVEINQGEGDVLAEYGRIPIKFDVENSNHVRIEAVGPRIAVYINDVLFTYLYDNTISSGDILLFVDFSGQELCSIVFDYLEISYQN